MFRVLPFLALLSQSIFAADLVPDALYLRHARDLIPQFLEDQSRTFGTDLSVDVDSLIIPLIKTPFFITDQPVEYGAFGFGCRRVEGFLPGPHARAMFFIRTVGQRFKLARTCEPSDEAPPRLAVELPGPRFERFDDEEFLDLARPLLAPLVAETLADAKVTWPWFAEWPLLTDFQNIYDFGPTHDCRHVTFGAGKSRVSVRIAYDTADPAPGIPAEQQRIVTDPVRLRRFRVALVDGCGWFSRAKPARIHRRTR